MSTEISLNVALSHTLSVKTQEAYDRTLKLYTTATDALTRCEVGTKEWNSLMAAAVALNDKLVSLSGAGAAIKSQETYLSAVATHLAKKHASAKGDEDPPQNGNSENNTTDENIFGI